jgi:hypothetical protein
MKPDTMSMDKQNASNREREIFLQALDRETPGERAAFLDSAARSTGQSRPVTTVTSDCFPGRRL